MPIYLRLFRTRIHTENPSVFEPAKVEEKSEIRTAAGAWLSRRQERTELLVVRLREALPQAAHAKASPVGLSCKSAST